jgi:glycosyltransferase involved in cell wall biosynthesis
VGYPTRELAKVYNHLSGVITDNRAIVDYLVKTFAFDENLFHSLRQPVEQSPLRVDRPENREKLGVLWAGRLVRQKRPDILIRVAEAAKSLPVHFHVYGEPQHESRKYLKELKRLKNASYYGVFDRFFSLPIHEFDIFLYTAQWDGMPNVILEAMSAGMACIAPDIGGISESLDESTGCLVCTPEAINEYVAFLSLLCSNRSLLRSKGKAAAARIARDNSWPGFVHALGRIPGYPPLPRGAIPILPATVRADSG